MRLMFFGVLLLSLAAAPAFGQQQKSPLKVLYVGPSPDEESPPPSYITRDEAVRYVELKLERYGAFEKLLNEHFDNVTMLVASDYKVEMSAKHDVTIFDERPPVIDTVEMQGWEKKIRLPDDFAHPAIMVGEVAPMTVGRFGNDYLLDHL